MLHANIPWHYQARIVDWHRSALLIENCGRLQCRIIIYKKGLEDCIGIVSPAALGGLKSEEYMALNPQGKMPLLTIPGGDPIPESEVPRSILGPLPHVSPNTAQIPHLWDMLARVQRGPPTSRRGSTPATVRRSSGVQVQTI